MITKGHDVIWDRGDGTILHLEDGDSHTIVGVTRATESDTTKGESIIHKLSYNWEKED